HGSWRSSTTSSICKPHAIIPAMPRSVVLLICLVAWLVVNSVGRALAGADPQQPAFWIARLQDEAERTSEPDHRVGYLADIASTQAQAGDLAGMRLSLSRMRDLKSA